MDKDRMGETNEMIKIHTLDIMQFFSEATG